MKKKIIIFILILSCYFQAKSQEDYVIFSDDFFGYEISGGFIPSFSWEFFLDNKDTLINNNHYKKLYYYTYNLADTIPYIYCCSYVREDISNKQVFFYSLYKNQEILLYDFGLNISDSVYIKNRDSFPSWGFNYFFYLYKISNIIYSNKYFKKYWLKTYPDTTSPDATSRDTTFFSCIEKIGSPYHGGLIHYNDGKNPLDESSTFTHGIYHYNKNIWCLDSNNNCPSPPDTLLNLINNKITGYIYEDKNRNCVKDSNENGIPSQKIKIMPDSLYVVTDSSGFFKIGVGKGSFLISPLYIDTIWKQSCTDSNYYQIVFNKYYSRSDTFYFGVYTDIIDNQKPVVSKESELISVSPNPVSNLINFRILLGYSSRIKIELYDTKGRRITAIFKGELEKNKEISFLYDIGYINENILLCKIITDKNVLNYKLIKTN